VYPPSINQLPTALAGPDKTITLPINNVTVSGSGYDPDGTITSYQWTKISGPAQYLIVSPTQAQTIINSLIAGEYQFELKVTDNNGAIARDTLKISVLDNQLSVSTAMIYPNPANSIVNVRINAVTNFNKGLIKILNVSGLTVFQKEITRDQPILTIPIDISSFITGIYLVKIDLDINSSITLKLIKD
jgi:hypothetical protein